MTENKRIELIDCKICGEPTLDGNCSCQEERIIKKSKEWDADREAKKKRPRWKEEEWPPYQPLFDHYSG